MFDFRGGEILMVIAFGCWSWYSTAAQKWCRGWSQIAHHHRDDEHGRRWALPVIFTVAALWVRAHFRRPCRRPRRTGWSLPG